MCLSASLSIHLYITFMCWHASAADTCLHSLGRFCFQYEKLKVTSLLSTLIYYLYYITVKWLAVNTYKYYLFDTFQVDDDEDDLSSKSLPLTLSTLAQWYKHRHTVSVLTAYIELMSNKVWPKWSMYFHKC